MAIRIASAFAVHPGDWLRTEIVEPNGLNVTDAARHLGVTRQAMSNLLNARAGLSADMAIRFEKAFGCKGGYAAQDADGLRASAGASESKKPFG